MNKSMNSATLYWITGLSGAGKTSLAKCLYRRLKVKSKAVVLLDGDELRRVYQLPGHYDVESRKVMAMRHAQMCELLIKQGMDVICPTISMFVEVRQWLSSQIKGYIEIYLAVDAAVLRQRQSAKSPLPAEQMVGQDIPAELPENPHIKLLNNGFLGITELCDQLEFYLSQQQLRSQQL